MARKGQKMKTMEKLKNQHQEILRIVDEIHFDLEMEINSSIANSLMEKIERLRSLLEIHLLIEDDFLYPALQKLPHDDVRNTATRFAIELGGIKEAFSEYLGKWCTPEDIVRSSSYFVSESNALFSALQQRIAKEDNELFRYIGP